MLALAATNGEQRRIVVEELDTGKTIANLNAGGQKVRALQWAGKDHLIVTVSTTGLIMNVETSRTEWSVATDFNITKKDPAVAVERAEPQGRPRPSGSGQP